MCPHPGVDRAEVSFCSLKDGHEVRSRTRITEDCRANYTSRASQAFFSVTDSGSILNRFSQDMTLIEGQLPIGVLITVSSKFPILTR